MNGSVLGTGEAAVRDARRWQLRPWPNDPTARLLVFVDHLSVPSPADLDAAGEAARAAGATTLRTSALFPAVADVATASGFRIIDTLALLKVGLDDHLDHVIEAHFGVARPATRPLRRRHHGRAAAIDQEAFGVMWGNDAASLADIRSATPVHRARCTRDGRRLTGFAISGTSGDTGYVQRLAVADAARRRGLARTLVADALRWMRRRGHVVAYVNTGVTNDAALALYEGLGFVRMDDHLVIAERRLVP